MGSIIHDLPNATSDSLILTHPTEEELGQIWTQNYAEWGGALTLEDYHAREAYRATIPLAAEGGMTLWILTDSAMPNEGRPVLSSCESIRKRVLVADGDQVREEIGYGIASVYTEPRFRGRKYAGRMLTELGQRLMEGVKGHAGKPVASALWSDIGKKFYANKGWAPFPSRHVSFHVKSEPANLGGEGGENGARPITYENLESFCKLDEQMLRERLAQDQSGEGKNTRFAFIPDHDALRWQFYRDDFMVSKIFKDAEPSAVKGAVAGPEGSRVWAVWTRNYDGDAQDSSKNNMYIQRFAVENQAEPIEDLVQGFRQVIGMALDYSHTWNLGNIEMWNPTPRLKQVIEQSGFDCTWVDREMDSIPSLMWYGKEIEEEVDWVLNQKFCWC